VWTVLLVACGANPDAPPPAAPERPGLGARLEMADGARFTVGAPVPVTWVFDGPAGDALSVALDREAPWGPRLDRVFATALDSGVVRPALPDADLVVGTPIRARTAALGGRTVNVPWDATDHVRFDTPGRYRLVVDTSRVTDGDAVVPARASLDLTVHAPDTLADARALEAARVLSERGRAPVTAARTLRLLGTRDATAEAVRQLGWHDGAVEEQLVLAVGESPHREAALVGLEQAVVHPARAVSSALIEGLARLSGAPESAVTERAAAAAQTKTGAARAITVGTLVRWADANPEPAWASAVVAAVPSSIADLPTNDAVQLFRSPRLVDPALAEPVDAWFAASSSSAGREAALRLLLRVDPERARQRVITTIAAPTRADGAVPALLALPDRALPEAEPGLRAQLSGTVDATAARFVSRYASPALLPDATAALDRLDPSVDPDAALALTAFLVQHDSPSADHHVARTLDAVDRSGSRLRVGALAALGWGPALERAAIRRLDDVDALLAADAASVLGKHPSEASTRALWARLEAFHATWAGKELPSAQDVARSVREGDPRDPAAAAWWLEHYLIDALRSTPGADPARLAALCVTPDGCRWANTAVKTGNR
jgi:hypothetical protein